MNSARFLPPLNSLRVFEAVARLGSFARAADELAVTPSAVSHQIRALEDYLGVQLLRRNTRRVKLTSAGESYALAVREALERIRTATRHLLAQRGEEALTLSVTPLIIQWLIPRLVEFQRHYPLIEVRLLTSVEPVDFGRSEVDAAIRWGTGQWPGLRSHLLLRERVTLLCAPSLVEQLREPADLAHVTLLHVLPRVGEWRLWLEAMGVSGVDPEHGPKFQNTPLALAAAAAGLGVVIADPRLAAGEVANGRLVMPFAQELPSACAYYLIFPVGDENKPAVAAFRDWLLQSQEQEAAETVNIGSDLRFQPVARSASDPS
ncbi:MAG TPA: transcriptional regulator GcvA [Candidatus Competibacteraceae bacterium]|nr:transcriptional regulator GcvA [Candidatus Competibacteraceae bacterium]